MTGVDAFLELLHRAGVTHLFGNPGTTELPLNDALARDRRIRYVLGLHECPVVAAADGRCWDGDGWVGLWSAARQFRRPDRAYELCEQESRAAERRSGVAGVICYIPPGTPSTMPLATFTDYSRVDLRGFAQHQLGHRPS
jgi:hypothetical protein